MSISIKHALARVAVLEAHSPTPELDVQVLLAHVLKQTRAYLYTWPERCLDDDQALAFEALLQRRASGEPVAYLTGRKEFWSLPLHVTPSTLIPRPDTELLVEIALELYPGDIPVRVADLGTGTCAIALALGSERPDWTVVATDREEGALQVAEQNRAALGLQNVTLLNSDWFASLTGQTFDLIVSNPPYIEEQDVHLDQGDVRFEPRTALVSGADGLADLRSIIAGASEHLRPQGWLALEHGFQQAEAVRALLTESGFLEVQTRTDLAGLERVTLARNPTTS